MQFGGVIDTYVRESVPWNNETWACQSEDIALACLAGGHKKKREREKETREGRGSACVSLARARSLFRPLLPSACYEGWYSSSDLKIWRMPENFSLRFSSPYSLIRKMQNCEMVCYSYSLFVFGVKTVYRDVHVTQLIAIDLSWT